MELRARAFGTSLAAFIVLFGLVALMPVAAAAQGQGANAASVEGLVKDAQGKPIAGATVVAASPVLQTGQITATTSPQGEYRLSPLAIGTYTVTYSAEGFQTVKYVDIALTVGFVAKLDVALTNGGSAEPITVSGATRLVDVTGSGTESIVSRATLEAVPGSRNMQELLGRASGVREDVDVGGSTAFGAASFHAFGQDGQQWIQVESYVTNNWKTGSQNQGAASIDRNAVAESRIDTLGHDADIPSRGIAMNVIFKSGSNTFHGEGFWAQTGSGLNGNNLDSTLKAEGITDGNPVLRRLDLDGQIGGRIIKDKLWFFQATRRRSETDQILGVYQDDGVTPGTNSPVLWYTTQKISYQLNPANRIVVFDQFNDTDSPSGASTVTAWDSRQESDNQNGAAKIEWQSVKGTSLVFSVLAGDNFGHIHNWGFDPGVVASTDLGTGGQHGQSLSDAQRSNDRRYGIVGSMTWFKPTASWGKHEVHLGVDYYHGGTSQGYGIRTCTGIACSEANAELVYKEAAGVAPYTTPYEAYIYDFPVIPLNELQYVAPYVEDGWNVSHNLTLNVGVRYAYNAAYLPAQCRTAASAPGDVAFPTGCFPLENFPTFNPITPRLHAAWDITGDGKTVLKGGWGRFAQQWGADQIQQANNNANKYAAYTWHAPVGTTDYLPGSVNLSLNGPDFVSQNLLSAQAPALGIPNPNLTDAISQEVNVSFERQLSGSLAVRGTYVYDHVQNYLLAGVQRPFSAYSIPVSVPIPNPNGVVPAGNTNGFLAMYTVPASLAGSSNSQTEMVNSSLPTNAYNSVEFAIVKRLSKRWTLNASYSYTKKNIPQTPPPPGAFNSIYLFIQPQTPNAEINAADHTTEWLGRAFGSYELPYGVVLSSNFSTRSGNTYAGSINANLPVLGNTPVYVTPIGAYRYPELSLLDFRVQKRVRLGGRQTVTLNFNLYNSLNANTVQTVTTTFGSKFNVPLTILPPRIGEFNATYSF